MTIPPKFMRSSDPGHRVTVAIHTSSWAESSAGTGSGLFLSCVMSGLAHIHDKKFAVILVEDDGTEDGAWSVLTGVAKWREGHLFMDRGPGFPEFPVPDVTLDRVKQVLPEVRQFLEEADYFMMLSVGPMPAGADSSEFIYTGLTLPRDVED